MAGMTEQQVYLVVGLTWLGFLVLVAASGGF